MNIIALYHVPFEKLGYIEDWIIQKGHTLSEIYLYKNQVLPLSVDFDLLIIMGGPMSVYDDARLPWLKPEKEFIRKGVEQGKAVLGICLGAQLLASVLESKVYPGKHKEIGWFPVRFNRQESLAGILTGSPEVMTVFHWHGDTFDLPPGSIRLASSILTPNQGFLYGDRVLGVQFHIEMKPENISLMINHAGYELVPGPHIQPADELASGTKYIKENNHLVQQWLDYFENLSIK